MNYDTVRSVTILVIMSRGLSTVTLQTITIQQVSKTASAPLSSEFDRRNMQQWTDIVYMHLSCELLVLLTGKAVECSPVFLYRVSRVLLSSGRFSEVLHSK